MYACGSQRDKLIKDDKGNKKREKQEAKDKQKIQSSIYQKQKKPKQYLLCASQFKRQLESQLTSNSKTLKQFIRIIDQIATFEDYHIFISKGQLKIMLRSISVYFQTILGQKDEQSIMDMKLYEPYQLFLESKKDWKRTVLSLLYFLQKIDEGMSEGGLQKDSDFQDRRRQLRQNEIDIWDRIQTIIDKQDEFIKQMTEKQQKINSLIAEINLKDRQINNYSQRFPQLSNDHKINIQKNRDQYQNIIKQNSSLKIQVQILKKYKESMQTKFKEKDSEIAKITAELKKTISNQSAKNSEKMLPVNVVKQQLHKKIKDYKKLINEMELPVQEIEFYVSQLEEIKISLQYI